MKQRHCRCEVLRFAQREVKCASTPAGASRCAASLHAPKVCLSCRKAHFVRKRPHLSPRQMWPFSWSRVRESNPPSRLGKPLYYRYTNPARLDVGIIADGIENFKDFLSIRECCVKNTEKYAIRLPGGGCGANFSFSAKKWVEFAAYL